MAPTRTFTVYLYSRTGQDEDLMVLDATSPEAAGKLAETVRGNGWRAAYVREGMSRERMRALVGRFPCQEFSVARRRKGTPDS